MDNIKMHLKDIWRDGVDGIQVTQDKILAAGFWETWQGIFIFLKKVRIFLPR